MFQTKLVEEIFSEIRAVYQVIAKRQRIPSGHCLQYNAT
jgi:hypothetical protein